MVEPVLYNGNDKKDIGACVCKSYDKINPRIPFAVLEEDIVCTLGGLRYTRKDTHFCYFQIKFVVVA